MEIVLFILGILVGLFIVLSLIIAIVIVEFSVRPVHESRAHARKNCIAKGYLEGTEGFAREPFEMVMNDGYVIHADISINDPSKVMLVCHGHGGNRETVMKFAKIFFAEGYSIVLYDQRGHGDNKKCKCLMGKQEHLDLLEIIAKVKEKLQNPSQFGIFGVSIGGSFTMMALKERQDIDFCVIDCSFADMETVFKDMTHTKFFFPFLLVKPFGILWSKIFHGLSLKDSKPRECIKNNHVPILFIHGEKDDLIRNHNQRLLIESLPNDCYYENYIFPNANHTESVNKDPIKYKEIFHNFINNINNNVRKEA